MPIVRSTALEILSEPLTLLVLLSALALSVLAPAFHYHQFGETTRMARDAGFSAMLTGSCVLGVFGTIRAFRRDRESGTMAMALVHPISRARFFLSKTTGAACACLVFAMTVFLVSLVIVEGAAIGGRIAQASGDLARPWGPCLAAGVGILLLPLVIGAVCNRFFGCRFVLTSCVCSWLLAVLASSFVLIVDRGLVGRMLPVALLIVLWNLWPLAAAAALSMRFRAHAAAAGTGLVLLVSAPAVGNYYLPDALAGAGAVAWAYVGLAALALLPVLALFLGAGIHLIDTRDVS